MTYISPDDLKLLPQSVATDLVDALDAPAALVSIADGAVRIAAAAGETVLKGAAAKAHQSFEIGSQTKMMTALVVLQLVEEGRLDLSQFLGTYLDAHLLDGVTNANLVTVGQLLQMTAGLANYTEIERPDGTDMGDILVENPDEVFDTEEIIALLQDLPAQHAPGTAYAYSNTNYFYLSEIIEAITGQGLGDVFAERIFEPLGMTDTYLNDFRTDPNKLSSYLGIGKRQLDVSDYLLDANGEGGVISTTADMTTFLRALLVDQTAASDWVLDQMTDFTQAGEDPRGFLFNNGLVTITLEGVGRFVGFSGGTLGTDSSTFLEVETGRIFSLALTQSNLETSSVAVMLHTAISAAEDTAWSSVSAMPTDGAYAFSGISAADLDYRFDAGWSFLSAENTDLRLKGRLSRYDGDDFQFEDGSQLLIGNGQADTLAGGTGQDALFGSRGADRLLGRAGADDLTGGAGRDKLLGGTGGDSLSGGQGRDWLKGGRGDDQMSGGQGRDVFVFSAANGKAELDEITDFEIGRDRLALRGRDVVEITKGSDHIDLLLDGDGDVIRLIGLSDADGLF